MTTATIRIADGQNIGTTWKDLKVVDGEGFELGRLGALVAGENEILRAIELNEDGSIAQWPGYFVAAPHEDADWDTPRVVVDYAGFREALAGIIY